MRDEDMSELGLVVVVDDNFALRNLVQMALEEEGYRVLSAGAGAEAINLLSQHAETCLALITDVDLDDPFYTGWDFAKKARELNPSIAVVYMTGTRGQEWSAKGVLGSVLLSKPFVLDDVLTAVSQLLGFAAQPFE